MLIKTQGVDSFSAQAAVKVFSDMSGVELSHLSVRDRDGLPDEFRDALLAKGAGKLHISTYDTIESYLIDVPAWTSLIAKGREARGLTPSPDEQEVLALVDEVCEELKDDTQDRIADALDRQYGKQKIHKAAGELASEARAVRNAAWTSLEEKLKFIPGKQLLARCRQMVKDRYKVTLTEADILATADPEGRIKELVELIQRCENL